MAEAPSEDELARAIAAHGRDADPLALGAAAGAGAETAERIAARIESARVAEAASRAPGPLTNPAVLGSLADGPRLRRHHPGGVRPLLLPLVRRPRARPQLLDPLPDPLVQGGLMHAALDRLYGERPGGDPLPRPGSLPRWLARGKEIVAEIAPSGSWASTRRSGRWRAGSSGC